VLIRPDHRIAGTYLIGQGLLGVVWWVLLFRAPTVRDWFVADAGWPVARQLVVADTVGFGIGSVIAGLAAIQRRSWAPVAAVAVLSITAYATLVAATWIAGPVDRWLGFVAMLAALAGTAISARTVMNA